MSTIAMLELETISLQTSLNHTMTVFKNDHITEKIKRDGLYEKNNILLFLNIISSIKNPVIFDIGANIGNHTLAFATQASRVLAFEPVPSTYDVLQENILQNGLKNIEAYPVALSNQESMNTIHVVQTGNVGCSSFDKDLSRASTPVNVQMVRGDDFLREMMLEKVDFIKLDIENYEAFALDGLRKTINKFLPIITMEWNHPKTIERMKMLKIITWLQEDYFIFVLGNNHDRHYWSNYSMAFIRRKIARIFQTKKLVLQPFNAEKLFKNVLLIPKNKFSSLQEILLPLNTQ